MTAPTPRIVIHHLDAVLADVRFDFEELPTDVEIRGRLMGPRCPGIDTIEVAYPVRRVGQGSQCQVLIPEPTFWETERPYVYEGPIEFWRGAEQVGKTWISVGLRKRV